MFFKSRIRKGLVFRNYETIDKRLISEIKKVNSSNTSTSVYQTIEWIISSQEILSSDNKINIIIGYFNGNISYILPIQPLFNKNVIIEPNTEFSIRPDVVELSGIGALINMNHIRSKRKGA